MEIRNIGTGDQGAFKPSTPLPPTLEESPTQPMDSAEIGYRRGPVCYMYAKSPEAGSARPEEVSKKRQEALDNVTNDGLVQPETAKKAAENIDGFNVSQ